MLVLRRPQRLHRQDGLPLGRALSDALCIILAPIEGSGCPPFFQGQHGVLLEHGTGSEGHGIQELDDHRLLSRRERPKSGRVTVGRPQIEEERVDDVASPLQVSQAVVDQRRYVVPEGQFQTDSLRQQSASSELGHTKPPRCRRRWHSHTPVASQISSFKRLARRLRNAYALPSQGSRPSAC
jgi:hypothetical protein